MPRIKEIGPRFKDSHNHVVAVKVGPDVTDIVPGILRSVLVAKPHEAIDASLPEAFTPDRMPGLAWEMPDPADSRSVIVLPIESMSSGTVKFLGFHKPFEAVDRHKRSTGIPLPDGIVRIIKIPRQKNPRKRPQPPRVSSRHPLEGRQPLTGREAERRWMDM